MKISPVEDLFSVINDTAIILQEELSITFLEALAETGENIFQNSILQEDLSELTEKRLKKSYESLQLNSHTAEEIRKSFQLAILKGMKESAQPNHQMTPDAVGLLVGYLVNKFVTKSTYRLFDPAVGTGNLLTTVMNQQLEKEIDGMGIDIDDLLIKLAYVNANLQQHPVELFNQDSLEPLFIELADAVVSDLPVGFYPNDVRANDFQLKSEKGHSYAHHLFIEQSLNYTKPGGYLFFIIPNGLFESEEAPKLHQYLKETAYIQGILQLPLSMFRQQNAAKSILILQKKGEDVKAPKQVLLVNLPSLSNGVQVESILSKIDVWMAENK
ncbi:class I SAM-dependent methyltransferase [Robertmurraya yapensis]|uniref:Class I SAM-dependent methyltransferase n=1 Tax=Bacillus yapensis TaxID=2492960 RepID=A0A431W2E6_9BACI|nr:class I SAM-dependent methyltransferase [Bacillus yapensis]RTR29601.1 class I SAM-dependent methyltransferase [Bacillus yapensis]TKS94947.1 class I SAM-dependent methyltransferase [Bacillus yapensis]